MLALSDHDITGVVQGILARRPAVGLALGVVDEGRLGFFHGHGVADLHTGQPIDQDTVFRVASITKTFTAVAVMQLWERGLLRLDDPADSCLRSLRLLPARPGLRQPTVRHLLTHTAGIGEVARPWDAVRPDFGESVPAGSPLPSLGEFYRGTLRSHAQAGTRFVYTNHDYAVLGQIVEDVSGMPLDRYLQENLLAPLGMTASGLLRSEQVTSRLATGYEIRSGGIHRVPERDMVTAGAASLFSTPADMARYLVALLGQPIGDGAGPLLGTDTLAMMFSPQYQPDPRIPGFGLGFFRERIGGHDVVGHQGSHPGFHSSVLLAPDKRVAVMAFTNGSYQADLWLPGAVSDLLAQLLGVDVDAPRPQLPQHPELWEDLRGWYRFSGQLTDIRIRGLIGLGVEIFIRGGRLLLRFLTPVPALARGIPLDPDDIDDPHVFRMSLPVSDMPPIRVVFGQDRTGATDRVLLDIMPLVLDRQPSLRNPRRWAVGAAGLGAATAVRALTRRHSTGEDRGHGGHPRR